MLNNVPVVPTLSKITDPMLKSRENVIMYLIRFLFVNPGGTTSINVLGNSSPCMDRRILRSLPTRSVK